MAACRYTSILPMAVPQADQFLQAQKDGQKAPKKVGVK